MSVPPDFRGVWRRATISIDGSTPSESHDVLWLQAREAFVDVRRPRSRDQGDVMDAFAGVTSWRAPELHWRHDIDLRSAGGEDRGTVEWNTRGFLERGEAVVEGAIVRYEEQWEQVVGGRDYLVALAEDGTAVLVTVGTHAIALADWRPENDGFAIRIMRATNGAWHETWRLGGSASLLPTPREFAGPTLDDAGIVVGGRRWQVTESTVHSISPSRTTTLP